jgi:hypothetical protein
MHSLARSRRARELRGQLPRYPAGAPAVTARRNGPAGPGGSAGGPLARRKTVSIHTVR